MLHRFATYEQAALFAAMKRDEGYHAEVLHDHVAFLWGPLAMGGVTVSVSEMAVEDEEEVPDLEPRPSWLPKEMSLVVAYTVVAVLGLLLFAMMLELLRYFSAHPLPAMIGLVLLALALAIFAAVVSVLGWLCSRWLHQIWDEQHRMHHAASGIHILLAVILIFCSTMVGELVLGCLVAMVAH